MLWISTASSLGGVGKLSMHFLKDLPASCLDLLIILRRKRLYVVALIQVCLVIKASHSWLLWYSYILPVRTKWWHILLWKKERKMYISMSVNLYQNISIRVWKAFFSPNPWHIIHAERIFYSAVRTPYRQETLWEPSAICHHRHSTSLII